MCRLPVRPGGRQGGCRLVSSPKKSLVHIQQVPEIGRLRNDLPQSGIRTLNLRKHPNYLVFYRLEKGTIELLRIRHGMMNLAELFSEPD
jgi:plasmid stabilization system protein ParE